MRILLSKSLRYAGKTSLRDVIEMFSTMYHYVCNVQNGTYKSYDREGFTVIIASFIYLVSPFDVIPDFIYSVGFIDDATVIYWAFNEYFFELKKFIDWEKECRNKH